MEMNSTSIRITNSPVKYAINIAFFHISMFYAAGGLGRITGENHTVMDKVWGEIHLKASIIMWIVCVGERVTEHRALNKCRRQQYEN